EMFRCVRKALFCLPKASLTEIGLAQLTVSYSQRLFVPHDSMRLEGLHEPADRVFGLAPGRLLKRQIRVENTKRLMIGSRRQIIQRFEIKRAGLFMATGLNLDVA